MTDSASQQGRTQIELCNTADVAPGTALKVEHAGLELAVFNVDGTYYVTDDHCTHGPGSGTAASSTCRTKSGYVSMSRPSLTRYA